MFNIDTSCSFFLLTWDYPSLISIFFFFSVIEELMTGTAPLIEKTRLSDDTARAAIAGEEEEVQYYRQAAEAGNTAAQVSPFLFFECFFCCLSVLFFVFVLFFRKNSLSFSSISPLLFTVCLCLCRLPSHFCPPPIPYPPSKPSYFPSILGRSW